MSFWRYKGRHLAPTPNPLAAPAAAVGTTTALLVAASPAKAGTHVVRSGETLSGIGARYGVSITRLARINDLRDANYIVAGMRLRVPGGGSSRRSVGTHTVAPGETLSEIATAAGVSVARLAKMNKIANPNFIVAGQKLRVPGGSNDGHVPSNALPNTSGAAVEPILENQAAGHGVSTSLVKAVAMQESGWQQNAISSTGAIGVMQVMPGTADYVNDALGGGNLNVRKTDDNVHLGVMYLDHMLDTMGTEKKALAAYYTGPGNVGSRLSKIQRAYVRSVQALKRRF